MQARKFAALLIVFGLTTSAVHAQSTPSLNLEGTGTLGPGPGACVPEGCSGQFSATLSGQLSQAVSQAALQMNLHIEPPFPCVCGAAPSSLCPAIIPCVAQADGPATPAIGPARIGTKGKNLEAQIVALQQQAQSLQQQIDALKSGATRFPLLPGCRPATGSGTFSDGQFSVSFTGHICSDNANNLSLSGPIAIVQSPLQPEVTWAAGTLVASGSIHIPAAANGNPIPISGPMVVSIVGAIEEIPALIP